MLVDSQVLLRTACAGERSCINTKSMEKVGSQVFLQRDREWAGGLSSIATESVAWWTVKVLLQRSWPGGLSSIAAESMGWWTVMHVY